MADLEQYKDPGFYMPPQDMPIYGSGLSDVAEYLSRKTAEAMKAIIDEFEQYRASIQTVGEGKYLRVREFTPSILDGEGEWNLPPADEDHVGEDTP